MQKTEKSKEIKNKEKTSQNKKEKKRNKESAEKKAGLRHQLLGGQMGGWHRSCATANANFKVHNVSRHSPSSRQKSLTNK